MAPERTTTEPRTGAGVSGVAPLVLVAILLVGLNLRGPIAAVGPVLEEIGADVGLTSTTAGLLTSLPVLCFAFAAPVAAWLGARVGAGRAVALGLVVMTVGIVGRVLGGAGLLLAGTVVIGLGMTIGNVLVPVVVKRRFGREAGRVTGLYTATLAGGAALTAGLVAPLSTLGGWRPGLSLWAVLPVLALVVWLVAVGRRDDGAAPSGTRTLADGASRSVWRQPMAWLVALTLGFQSALYYSLTTWMPTMLRDELDLSRQAAGNAMSVFQLVAIPATLLIPALCRVRATQVWLGVVVGGGWGVTVAGLLLAPQWWLLWSVVGAVAQGAGISLSHTLVVLRAGDADAVRRLGAMSQLIGYGLGALGPVVLGALDGATGSWTAPLLVLCAVAVLMTGAGAAAGRDRPVV